jgi:putative PEP-CTERM system histidine kinase
MLIPFFYTANLLILLSGLLVFRKGSGERNFSLALVQALLALPLLACEYLYLTHHWEFQAVRLILFSEIVFVIIWFSLALRLNLATRTFKDDFRMHFSVEVLFGAVFLAIAWYFPAHYPVVEIFDVHLSFRIYGPVYFSAILVLIAVLYAAWLLEQFWRPLSGAMRWEYKFLVVGSYLVCGTMAWSNSYRITYLSIFPQHLQLLSTLLLVGWVMMCYAVFHHRLLNRKIFVSRKVVYAFVVPSLLGAYLLGFGMISLIMRTFGLQLSFVLKWFFLAVGLLGVGVFGFSGKIRRRAQFFISTHFYINKYEYRDEWLALSQQLQGALSEAEVVKALREVLAESLYTTEIYIWLGGTDSAKEFKLISSPEYALTSSHPNNITAKDPLVRYIKTHSHFHKEETEPDPLWQEVMDHKNPFLASLNLTLLAPISIGNQLAGLIGLGPEFTGGKYGHDDFDLLTALGSQTASALLAVRMAEELAHAREQQAWHRLSAFVLHDIKNAGTMLSLLQENAPQHIHEPEFQQDMLELVDDALKRMRRIEQRLGTLKDDITAEWQDLELSRFLKAFIRNLRKKLPSVEVDVESSKAIQISSDPELLASILENLLLNAYEAKGEGTVVRIELCQDDDAQQVLMEIADNGPGIAAELLPDALFEPFKSRKDGGSGIGLWQVKRMITSLEGTISADNNSDGGARFVIKLPLSGG